MQKAASFICSASIPIIILIIICFALIRRVSVFDAFREGAADGLKTSLSIVTPIIGLMVAISMLRASGALDLFAFLLRPLTSLIGLDENLLPLALLRPVSGSGSLGIVSETVARFGADSVVAKTACVMAGSPETTFYTLAVYFGAVGIKKTRHSAAAAILADIAGVIICIIVCSAFFGTA